MPVTIQDRGKTIQFIIITIALLIAAVGGTAIVEAGTQPVAAASVATDVTSNSGSGYISGFIYNESNEKISNKIVSYTIVNASSGNVVVASDTSNGEFTASVGVGEYQVTASAEGYENSTSTVSVTDGETASVNLVLQKSAKTVPDDLEPPTIHEVRVLNESVSPGDKLVMAINATDQSKIVAMHASIDFRDDAPEGYGQQAMSLSKSNDNGLGNGTTLLSTTVPSNAVIGTWKLDYVNPVEDEHGNEADIYSFDSSTKLEVVTGSSDSNTPPNVTFRYSPDEPSSDEQIQFSANATDSDGNITGYNWTFGDGTSARGPSSTHTYANSGEYTVELIITDNDGETASAQQTITVESANQQPSVNFSYSPSNPAESESVQFSANATDPDGNIADYTWSFGNGATASGSSPSHTYSEPGEYTVELTVTDNGGKSATATQTISIKDVNQQPTVSFSYSPTNPDEDQSVQFTADASDPDGNIADYSWSFGDGSSASGSSPSHTYSEPEEYTVELTVTDNGGKSATATQTISIRNVNKKPTVDLEFEPESAQEGSTVTFTAEANDPDGRITEYEWEFDDGSTGSGSSVYHTFDDPGEYDVTLTVEDNSGAEASDSEEIAIDPSPEPQIQSVTPSTEGATLEGVEFRNTYHVEIESQQEIREVQFKLAGTTKVDTNGEDGWSQSLNLGVLNDNSQLKVTAVDSDGDTDTYTAHIEVNGIPSWLKTLKDSGEVTVDDNSVIISKRVPDPPIDASMTIPGVPVVGGTQSFEARSEMRVVYDMPNEDAHVMAEGKLDVQIFKRSGEGEISGHGRLNADEWDLRNGELTVRVEVTAFRQTWEFAPTTGVGWIDNSIPKVGVSVSGRPTARLNVQVDNRNSNLAVTRGTLAPGAELAGSVYQDVPLGSVEANVDADVTGAISVPEPYNPRATAKTSASGSVCTLGGCVEMSVGPYKRSIGGGTSIQSMATASNATVSEWQFRDATGDAPGVSDTRVGGSQYDVEMTRVMNMPTAHPNSTNIHSAVFGAEQGIPTTLVRGQMMRSPGSLARLTLNQIEDRSPAVTNTQDGYGLVWERQDPTDSNAAGNDIYWRTNNGSSWSQPQQLSNNTKIELNPDIATAQANKSQHIAAWILVDRPSDEANGSRPAGLINETEIAIATTNDGNWSQPTKITDNDMPDFSVRVAQSDDRRLLTWVRDEKPAIASEGKHVRYALLDEEGSLLETGRFGQTRSRSPVVASMESGNFRVAYFAPAANAQQNGTVIVGSFTDTFRRTGTYDTTRFRDLSVSNQSIAWVDGPASKTDLHYSRDGETSLVDTERDITDIIEVNLFNGAGTDVLTYRGESDESRQKQIFYQLRRGDSWRAERPIAGGDRTNLTFWQVTSAPRQDAFISVFMGRNFSADQTNDLFAIHHAYHPDLAVNVSTNVSEAEPHPGDDFTITYNVTNNGDLPVTSAVTVDLYAGSNKVASHQYDKVAVGKDITGTFTATVGSHDSYTVRITPNTPLNELSKQNNMQTITPFQPDLKIATVNTTRIGDQVQYNLTVANTGAVSAEEVEYAVQNGNSTLSSGRITTLGGKDRQQISDTVSVNNVNASAESFVVIDPADTVEEADDANNRHSVTLLASDLTVSRDAITYYEQGNELVASVTVANQGSGATTGTVQITHAGANVGHSPFSIDGAPRSNATVFTTVNVSVTGVDQHETVTAVVQSDIAEANSIDNAAIDTVQNVTTIKVGPPLSQYTNANGVVGNSGLNKAVQDYLSGNLANSKLNTVIRSYLSGDSIVQ